MMCGTIKKSVDKGSAPRIQSTAAGTVLPDGLSFGRLELHSANDEAHRRCAHVIKRKASDQSQSILPCWIQHGDIVWPDDSGGNHAISIQSLEGVDAHYVSGADSGQRSKKGISVTGDRHIAMLTRQRGPRYMAYGPVKLRSSDPFYYHDGNAESRDLKLSKEGTSLGNPHRLRNGASIFEMQFLIEKPCVV